MARSTSLRKVERAPEAGRFATLAFADVAVVAPDGALEVCVGSGGSSVPATPAVLGGYRPAVGDRVIVTDDGAGWVVVAVVRAATPPGLVSASGAEARLMGDGIAVFDRDGAFLVRARGAGVEVAPSTGDLLLSAPQGRIRLSAAEDIEIEGERDVTLKAARRVEARAGAADSDLPDRLVLDDKGALLTGRRVELRGALARMVAGRVDVVSREVRVSANTVSTTARKIETTTERAVLRAKEVVQEVAELLETRAGRLRTLVRGALSVRSRVTTMKSEGDTSIDGKRVLLG